MTGALDAGQALARRNWIVSGWDDKGQVDWLDGVDATLVRGRGRLAGIRTVEVEARDGSRRRLSAARAVILATGSTAFIPPVEGLRGIRHWDTREATSARKVPGRLLVLGGGPAGVEMAQAWRRLGSREVTVVEGAPRLLHTEEAFAGEQVAAAFAAEGITVITGTRVTAVHRATDDAPVRVTLQDGRTITADEILVAVGRQPDTADLGLDIVGLEPGRPVPIDGNLRATGVPGGWLYAIGDVNGQAPLTHMGKYQARVAVSALLGYEDPAVADDTAIPRVVFTDPQVASVGLTEAQARDRGIQARAVRVRLEDVAAAAINGEGVTGTAQLVVDEARQVIVGATFTGPDIGEALHAATIAVIGSVPMNRLRHAVPAFPSLSEVWLDLILAYEDQGQNSRQAVQEGAS